jgi:hypothetical protein
MLLLIQWRDADFVNESYETSGDWRVRGGIGTGSINDPSTTAQPWTSFQPVEMDGLHPDVVHLSI